MTPKEKIEKYTENWTSALNEQLRRAGARTNCPMCGNDDWTLLFGTDEHDELLGLGVPMFRDLSVGGYLPAATLSCDHCGFVRQHLVRTHEKKQHE